MLKTKLIQGKNHIAGLELSSNGATKYKESAAQLVTLVIFHCVLYKV